VFVAHAIMHYLYLRNHETGEAAENQLLSTQKRNCLS